MKPQTEIILKHKICSILTFLLLFVPGTELYSTEIILKGLEKTDRAYIYGIINGNGSSSTTDYEDARKRLIDLDIFASVKYEVLEDEVVFHFKELPSYLIFPAMKRTDQDGLLVGPGIVNLNMFGKGVKQLALTRFTVYPEPLRAKDILYYIYIPELFRLPFEFDFETNYFDSYNTLKLYDENSLFNSLNIRYSYLPVSRIELSGTQLFVKHDEENLYYEENEDIKMFLGNGNYDYVPSLGLYHILDLRNRNFNTHRGIYWKTGASINGERLGGDGDYRVFLNDLRLYFDINDNNILHSNMLTRYRPGTVPGYELYHIGGVNSLRSVSPSSEIYGQHELLYTFEYRHELFNYRQVSLWDMNGYYGLQLVLGNDHAHYWQRGDSFKDGKHLSSIYFGLHILVPALERIRIEMGINTVDTQDRTFSFGINWGWYEKGQAQGGRVR